MSVFKFSGSTQHQMTTLNPVTTSNTHCTMVCHINYTKAELDAQIEQLRKELQIDKKSTSRYRNTLISADDDRKSAAYIGYFGAFFLASLFGCLLILDLPNLKHMVDDVRKNISSFCNTFRNTFHNRSNTNI